MNIDQTAYYIFRYVNMFLDGEYEIAGSLEDTFCGRVIAEQMDAKSTLWDGFESACYQFTICDDTFYVSSDGCGEMEKKEWAGRIMQEYFSYTSCGLKTDGMSWFLSNRAVNDSSSCTFYVHELKIPFEKELFKKITVDLVSDNKSYTRGDVLQMSRSSILACLDNRHVILQDIVGSIVDGSIDTDIPNSVQALNFNLLADKDESVLTDDNRRLLDQHACRSALGSLFNSVANYSFEVFFDQTHLTLQLSAAEIVPSQFLIRVCSTQIDKILFLFSGRVYFRINSLVDPIIDLVIKICSIVECSVVHLDLTQCSIYLRNKEQSVSECENNALHKLVCAIKKQDEKEILLQIDNLKYKSRSREYETNSGVDHSSPGLLFIRSKRLLNLKFLIQKKSKQKTEVGIFEIISQNESDDAQENRIKKKSIHGSCILNSNMKLKTSHKSGQKDNFCNSDKQYLLQKNESRKNCKSYYEKHVSLSDISNDKSIFTQNLSLSQYHFTVKKSNQEDENEAVSEFSNSELFVLAFDVKNYKMNFVFDWHGPSPKNQKLDVYDSTKIIINADHAPYPRIQIFHTSEHIFNILEEFYQICDVKFLSIALNNQYQPIIQNLNKTNFHITFLRYLEIKISEETNINIKYKSSYDTYSVKMKNCDVRLIDIRPKKIDTLIAANCSIICDNFLSLDEYDRQLYFMFNECNFTLTLDKSIQIQSKKYFSSTIEIKKCSFSLKNLFRVDIFDCDVHLSARIHQKFHYLNFEICNIMPYANTIQYDSFYRDKIDHQKDKISLKSQLIIHDCVLPDNLSIKGEFDSFVITNCKSNIFLPYEIESINITYHSGLLNLANKIINAQLLDATSYFYKYGNYLKFFYVQAQLVQNINAERLNFIECSFDKIENVVTDILLVEKTKSNLIIEKDTGIVTLNPNDSFVSQYNDGHFKISLN